jgi:hypothetical protein
MDNNITYHPPLIFAFGNDQVRVHRPILTDAERAVRLERIKKAAAKLLYEVDMANKNSNTKNT